MKHMLTLSILFLSITAIEAGNWISYFSDERSQTIPVTTWNNIKEELITNGKNADCSSATNVEELIKKLQDNFNTTLQENPEAFPTLRGLMQNEQFEKNEDMQKRLAETLMLTIIAIALEKQEQHRIPGGPDCIKDKKELSK